MNVVQGRENGPNAVNLTPVPVDLRDDEEDREERERKGEARNDRVRGSVDVLQGIEVANVGEDLLGKRVELWNVGFYSRAVRSAVGECLDQGHCYPDWRSDEHICGSGRGWCLW